MQYRIKYTFRCHTSSDTEILTAFDNSMFTNNNKFALSRELSSFDRSISILPIRVTTVHIIVSGTIILLNHDELNELKLEFSKLPSYQENSLVITQLNPKVMTRKTIESATSTAIIIFIGISIVFSSFGEYGIESLVYGKIPQDVIFRGMVIALLPSLIGFGVELLLIHRERVLD